MAFENTALYSVDNTKDEGGLKVDKIVSLTMFICAYLCLFVKTQVRYAAVE